MRRRALLRTGAVLGAAVLWPSWSRADAASRGDLDHFLTALARARSQMKTMVAPFTQERTIGLLATQVKSTGQMTLVLPDRLRWDLLPPDAATYWVSPEGIAYRTATGGGRLPPKAGGVVGLVLADLLTLLGGDLHALSARYDLTLAKGPPATLEARPRSPDLAKLIRRIELQPGDDFATPRRVVLEESERERSVITFGAVQRDVDVSPERMRPP